MYRYITVILFLILTLITTYALSKSSPELVRQPLKEFPEALGEWKSVNEQIIDGSSMEVLQVDDYIMRTYSNDENNEIIGLYIGYFYNQREGKQVHSPRQCLPGAGWQILDSHEYNLKGVDSIYFNSPINYYLMGKGDQKQLYLWWYQGRGRIISNEYKNKIYLILDSILKQRTDGALVRVNIPVSSNIKKALETQEEFIKTFIPILDKYIPN